MKARLNIQSNKNLTNSKVKLTSINTLKHKTVKFFLFFVEEKKYFQSIESMANYKIEITKYYTGLEGGKQ